MIMNMEGKAKNASNARYILRIKKKELLNTGRDAEGKEELKQF